MDIFEKLKETNRLLKLYFEGNSITDEEKLNLIKNEIFRFLIELDKEYLIYDKNEYKAIDSYNFIVERIDIKDLKAFQIHFSDSIAFFMSKIYSENNNKNRKKL